MRTISKLLRSAAVALAVALGASTAFGAADRPVNDAYWKWEPCPYGSGSSTTYEKGNYRLQGDAANQKKGLELLAEKLVELNEGDIDEYGAFLHVVFTQDVTITKSDTDLWNALEAWLYEYGGYGSLRIISELIDVNGPVDGERHKVIFDGGGTQQIFNLRSTDADEFHARFVGITFDRGHSESDYGGAVYANCNASFLWCTFTNCKADGGGAICAPGDINDDNLAEDIADVAEYFGTAAIQGCKFLNCESTSYGGAVWGNTGGDSAWTCVIYDSTFDNCKAGNGYHGGALYGCYHAVHRCKFSNCKVTGSGYGGAAYACAELHCCLFVNCTSQYEGGAVSCGASTDSSVKLCTFINCTDKDGNAVYDVESDDGDVTLYSCVFYGCGYQDGDNNITYTDEYNVIIEDKNYFANFDSGDYHFNVCDENGEGGWGDDPKPGSVLYIWWQDVDRRYYNDGGRVIAGCYSYYSKEQWKDELYKRKKFEYDAGCDPLLVTTTLDSNDNKDGVVSFREALTYFGDAAIRAKSSHQERIDFQLSGNRVITLKGDAINVAQVLMPLMINGGDNGITLEHESNPEWAIRFNGASSDIRTFQNVTVKLGIRADDGGAEVGFRFINCKFVGGNTPFASGRVGTWAGWNRYDIEWKFERCSFTGYTTETYILEMGELKTTATFDACTFAQNSNPNPSMALIRGVGKAVYFRNCTFFDNDVRTMCMNPEWSGNYPSENYFNCIICESDCRPSASSSDNAISANPLEVFDSAVPVKTTVNGVEQIGFHPKHRGTSRGGHASYSDWRQVPERDIFNHNNPSDRYISQGSYYVDDYEDPSLRVNVPWDGDPDPYDDCITLREALTYAADPKNKHIITGTTVCPIFTEDAVQDGKVVITLDHAINFYEDIYGIYPFELHPGDDQTLTITAPNSPDGAFRIGDGMKMRVKDTTFESCVTKNRGGVGGAIGSSGELLVDGCRFDKCETDQSEGVGGALFLTDASKTVIYGTTFSNCKSNLGGAIGSCGDLVAICVTLTGNSASTASAVAVADSARTLFANATIVDNTANSGGAAFRVMGGVNAGLINSIVAGNTGGNLAGSWSAAPTKYNKNATGNWYAYSLTEGEIADIFLTANALPTNMPNGVTQLYYPLKSASKAKDGAFVFTKGGLNQNGEVVAGSWPERVGYSTTIDGFYPYPRELNGLEMGDKYGADFNGYPTHDLTGALITFKDTGMGAVPSFAADVIDASSLVNTLEDVVDDTDGKVSLREAAEYAMAHGGQVNFDAMFLLSSADFKLNNQIVVPEGCSFELKSPSWKRITLHATATDGNRFFRVEGGGTLKLEGITLRNGTARGIYGIMSPPNDSNGGAVCGVVSGGERDSKKISDLSFVNCRFLDNQAPKGYGGAIYAEGRLNIENCSFSGNSAGSDGGAVYSKAATMTMTGGEVSGNSAGENGGGIGISPGSATNIVKSTAITGNTAGRKGGGVYSGDGQPLGYVLLQDVPATGNQADPELSVDQNVYTGAGYTFNERYVLRVNRKYYVVKKDEMGIERIELSDEATPVLGAIDLGAAATSGKATVKVTNVIPNLEYGLGHAESPVGPYEVDKWVKATSECDLNLEAPAEGSGGFYRVMAREAE